MFSIETGFKIFVCHGSCGRLFSSETGLESMGPDSKIHILIVVVAFISIEPDLKTFVSVVVWGFGFLLRTV